MNSILIIAHAPLASALRQCALHVFPDSGSFVSALDVLANVPFEETFASVRITIAQRQRTPQDRVLVLADAFGATPCNVALKLVDGVRSRLVAGVNLPMLLRVVDKPNESLDELVQRALIGGTSGVMQAGPSAPQNQPKRTQSDKDNRDDQQ